MEPHRVVHPRHLEARQRRHRHQRPDTGRDSHAIDVDATALGERYDTLNALLRDAAGALAGRRDRDVARETLRSLRRGRLLTAAQYSALLPRIDATVHDAAHVARANTDARRLLKAADVYLRKLELPELDDSTLARRLAHNRTRCRRRWREAREHPGAEALHEWRKLVKHLTTQSALLAQRVTDAGADVAALKELGETLGRHHDHHQLALQLNADELPDTDLLRLRLHDALRRRQDLPMRTAAWHALTFHIHPWGQRLRLPPKRREASVRLMSCRRSPRG